MARVTFRDYWQGVLDSLLCEAIYSNSIWKFRLLLFLGADPTTSDGMGISNYPILLACRRGSYDIVKRLLRDPRVDPSANNNLAIMDAVAWGHSKIVRELLQYPAVDPSVDNNRAIVFACSICPKEAEERYDETVEILLQNPKVNPAEYYDNKALIQACDYRNKNIVKLLLADSRVNPSAHDNIALLSVLSKLSRQKFDSHNTKEILKLLLNDPRTNVTGMQQTLQKYASHEKFELLSIFNTFMQSRSEKIKEASFVCEQFGVHSEDIQKYVGKFIPY